MSSTAASDMIWLATAPRHAQTHTLAFANLAVGVLLMLGLDEFTPDEHDKPAPVARVTKPRLPVQVEADPESTARRFV